MVLIAAVCLPLAGSLAIAPAAAQEAGSEGPGANERDTIVEHEVRPGETLQSITYHYLGTLRLWRENWRLNPLLKNPNALRVGQTLRVIKARRLEARQASIDKVAGEVDKHVKEFTTWQDAAEGDRLFPGEGVRTLEASSTELLFDEGSSLSLSENSRVFLKDLETSLEGINKGTIQLQKGQVDLALLAKQPEKNDIRLVVGETVSRPRAGLAGRADTRARMGESGGTELMVYEGNSKVEAAGEAVAVAKGMGTTVPQGEPPNPPEKLLPRPSPVAPAAGSSFSYANPVFRWRPVTGASSYTLEVCSDPVCSALVKKEVGIAEESWSPHALPDGQLFWRITAVAPSGLDGYPTRPLPLDVVAQGRRDLEPPLVVVFLTGSGRALADGSFELGVGSALRLTARDDASGVAEILYRWNEGPWSPFTGRDLTPPGSGAEHRLTFRSMDRRGSVSEDWDAMVRVDSEAPEVPSVSRAKS